MDDDNDIIARIYPADVLALTLDRVIKHSANRHRYVPQNITADDDDDDGDGKNALNPPNLPHLVLRFSEPPKTQGFIIGTHPDKEKIDIFIDREKLPGGGKISNEHCIITFDEEHRLILKDMSTGGTIVTYGNKGDENKTVEKRSHFTWILSGPNGDGLSYVRISQHIRFRVFVPRSNHSQNPNYSDKVKRFRSHVLANPEVPEDLRFSVQTESIIPTAAPSESATPTVLGTGRILLTLEKLGAGGFGMVTRMWDVSTGLNIARKSHNPKKDYDDMNWVKEIRVMRAIKHDHIIKYLGDQMIDGKHTIDLEFAPHGDLASAHEEEPFSPQDILHILKQCLQALDYLHTSAPTLTHRDIKSNNILVMRRDPICVKLGDFGISKRDLRNSPFDTLIGTKELLAPEQAKYIGKAINGKIPQYTCAVDIWALAVTAAALLGAIDLRYYIEDTVTWRVRKETAWCTIVRYFTEMAGEKSEPLIKELLDLLGEMLSLDPARRPDARTCLTRVESLIAKSGPATQPSQLDSSLGKRKALPAGILNSQSTTVTAKRLAVEKNVEGFSRNNQTTTVPSEPAISYNLVNAANQLPTQLLTSDSQQTFETVIKIQ